MNASRQLNDGARRVLSHERIAFSAQLDTALLSPSSRR